MNDLLTPDVTVLFLFLYLLPGFLGQVIYGYLVEGEPQDKFDRVVTAFVLSLLSILSVHSMLGVPFIPNIVVTASTPSNAVLQAMIGLNLLYTSIAAALIAIIVAVLNNHNIIYGLINRLKISYKTSNADVWQDIFYRHRGFWLKLDFADGKSLVGWPKYFSATGKPRELFLADASWWYANEANAGNSVVDISGPGIYISDLSTIISIEILN